MPRRRDGGAGACRDSGPTAPPSWARSRPVRMGRSRHWHSATWWATVTGRRAGEPPGLCLPPPRAEYVRLASRLEHQSCRGAVRPSNAESPGQPHGRCSRVPACLPRHGPIRALRSQWRRLGASGAGCSAVTAGLRACLQPCDVHGRCGVNPSQPSATPTGHTGRSIPEHSGGHPLPRQIAGVEGSLEDEVAAVVPMQPDRDGGLLGKAG